MAAPTLNYGVGNAIQNPLTNQPAVLISASIANGPGGTAGRTWNQVVIGTFPVGTTPVITGTSPGNVNGGQTFTVADVESVSGLLTSSAAGGAFQTVTLAKPVTLASGQWVAVTFQETTGAGPWIMACDASCSGPPTSSVYGAVAINWGSTTPSVGGTGTSSSGFGEIAGGTFQPLSQTTTGGSITQCYGNCGSPAITLANTNFTKKVNFNQSITLFYQFQSNLNGFILNVTTSLAATTNSNQQFQLAIYTATCAASVSPFTNACPGQLAQGQTFIGTQVVGRQSMRATNIGVLNGEWVGISVTALFAGLILNDTNTPVPLQFTTGMTPSIISSSATFNATSRTALWAWINGQATIGTPPSVVGPCQASSFAGIDCLFPTLVNTFCTTFSASCQTSSALFWVVILSVFSLFILQFGAARLIPGSKLIAGGEIFILLFVSFILMFSGLGLLPIWVPVLIFFIVSLFMGKNLGKYI